MDWARCVRNPNYAAELQWFVGRAMGRTNRLHRAALPLQNRERPRGVRVPEGRSPATEAARRLDAVLYLCLDDISDDRSHSLGELRPDGDDGGEIRMIFSRVLVVLLVVSGGRGMPLNAAC